MPRQTQLEIHLRIEVSMCHRTCALRLDVLEMLVNAESLMPIRRARHSDGAIAHIRHLLHGSRGGVSLFREGFGNQLLPKSIWLKFMTTLHNLHAHRLSNVLVDEKSLLHPGQPRNLECEIFRPHDGQVDRSPTFLRRKDL